MGAPDTTGHGTRHSSLLQDLEAITGTGHVLTGEGLEAYERDWRRRWHGRALAVVRPADAQQVCDKLDID